jgi:hypothetical protein
MYGRQMFNKPVAVYQDIINNSRAWLGYNGSWPVFLNIPDMRPGADIRSQGNIVNAFNSQRTQPCKQPSVFVEIGFYRRCCKQADWNPGPQIAEKTFGVVFVVSGAVVACFQAAPAGYALAVFYPDLDVPFAITPGKIGLVYRAYPNAAVASYAFVEVIGNYISHVVSWGIATLIYINFYKIVTFF